MNALKNITLSLSLILSINMPTYSNDIAEGKKLAFDRKKGNCLACHMIDDGELDWKLVAIKGDDELAASLNDISDVETKCPGTISGIREWFRWYKTPDGKPVNAFGHNEEALGKETALEVIQETHEYWKDLVEGRTKVEKIWT